MTITELEAAGNLELRLETEGGWTVYAWCDVTPKWSRLADLGERFIRAHVAWDYEILPETGEGFTKADAVRQMVLCEALAAAEGRSPRPWSEWAVERPQTGLVPILGPPGDPHAWGIDVCERGSDGRPRVPVPGVPAGADTEHGQR